MSTENPVEKLAQDIASAQREVDALESKARLASARDALENLETTISGLPQHVKDIRARGYVFEKELEDKASDLANRWQQLRGAVQQQIDTQTSALEPDLRSLEAQMGQLSAWNTNPDVAAPLLAQIKAQTTTLNGKVDGVERTLTGMYDAFKSEVSKLTDHLKQIDWMQTQLAEATFQLLPSEGAINAVPAMWYKQGKRTKDDPDGILYLTDQRILFEQKQEVATKKVLFITTEKQKVQKLLLELPVAQVESAKASKQGLMGHEDHLDVSFASGAPQRATHFHLNGQDSNLWQAYIGRAKAHDYDSSRSVPIDSAQAERVRSAPNKCPNCGGSITQPITRGMDSIKCEFCGTVIRL